MTPTEAALQDILLIALNTDGFSWSAVSIDSLRLLLARYDRYEKALREIDAITKGHLPITAQIKQIAQEALRCE